MDKIKEVMGLVDLHRNLPDSEWRVNASREFIESKLRELLGREPLSEDALEKMENKLWAKTVDQGKPMFEFVRLLTRNIERAHGIGNDSKEM